MPRVCTNCNYVAETTQCANCGERLDQQFTVRVLHDKQATYINSSIADQAAYQEEKLGKLKISFASLNKILDIIVKLDERMGELDRRMAKLEGTSNA